MIKHASFPARLVPNGWTAGGDALGMIQCLERPFVRSSKQGMPGSSAPEAVEDSDRHPHAWGFAGLPPEGCEDSSGVMGRKCRYVYQIADERGHGLGDLAAAKELALQAAQKAFGSGCHVEGEWILNRKLVWASLVDHAQDEAPVGEIARQLGESTDAEAYRREGTRRRERYFLPPQWPFPETLQGVNKRFEIFETGT